MWKSEPRLKVCRLTTSMCIGGRAADESGRKKRKDKIKRTLHPCLVTKGIASKKISGKSRYLFSGSYDELTASQANNILTRGRGTPFWENLVYLVFSFRDDERGRFGRDINEIDRVLREATRAAMRELASALDAHHLFWVAGAFPDAPQTPYVKVLLDRSYSKHDMGIALEDLIGVDDDLHLCRIEAFPQAFVTRNQKQPSGTTVRISGNLSDAFLTAFDEELQGKHEMPLNPLTRCSGLAGFSNHRQQSRSAFRDEIVEQKPDKENDGMNDKPAQTECVKRWAIFFDTLELTRENNSRTFNLNEIDFTPDFYIKDWDAFVGINPNVTPDEEAMQQYQLICSITGQRAIYICGFPSLNNYKATVFSRDEDSEMLEEGDDDDGIPTTHVLITEGEFRECRRCPNIIFAGDIEDGESNLSFGLGHKNAPRNCFACGDYEPIIGDAIEKASQAAMAADLTNDNSSSILPAGDYHVVVEGAHATRDRTTKTDDHPRGEPMIVWNLKIIGGEYGGQHLRRKQSINSVTYNQMIADLQLCDVHCDAENLLANLPRVRGVELDITVSDDAARTITFSHRLDNKSFAERGVSEQIEHFPDAADEFGKVAGVPEKLSGQTTKSVSRAELQSATEKLADKLTEKAKEPSHTPIIQVFSSEEWDCHDSLLNDLDPNFMVIDEEQ